MELEDGEIVTPEEYDPEYEWPGEDSVDSHWITSTKEPNSPPPESHSSPTSKRKVTPTLRLLVTASSVLPPRRNLIVLDGYTQVQVGRDHAPHGSAEPRIRLKEMAVSKVHACLYLEEDARYGSPRWGLVDMGSKHGTFVKSALDPQSSNHTHSNGTRLSAPKTASLPHTLRHLDVITIGSTTFSAHIHQDGLPCQQCSSESNAEVALFPPASQKRPLELAQAQLDSESGLEKDPKRALTMLKRALLTRHTQALPRLGSDCTSTDYVDRSARRRALYPVSPAESPGVRRPLPAFSRSVSPTPAVALPPQGPPTTPEPTSPISDANVGHKLLRLQGWQPGTPLGLANDEQDGSSGLVEPLKVIQLRSRAGLGAQAVQPTDCHDDWKEDAKRKRWDRTIEEDKY